MLPHGNDSLIGNLPGATKYGAGGGGGASDIRLGSQALADRIVVAGGKASLSHLSK